MELSMTQIVLSYQATPFSKPRMLTRGFCKQLNCLGRHREPDSEIRESPRGAGLQRNNTINVKIRRTNRKLITQALP